MESTSLNDNWRRLSLHALAIVVSISGLLLVAPLLPAIIEHFGLTARQAGIAVSLLWGANALAQYPGGRFADGASAELVIRVSQLLLLAGLALLMLSRSILGFVGGLVLLGVGYGLFEPAGFVMLHERFEEHRGRAFGIRDSAVNLGSVLAAGLAVLVLGRVSWRVAFLPLAVLLLGVGTYTARAYRLHSLSFVPLRPRETYRRLTQSPRMAAILLVMSVSMFIWQGSASFLPTYLQTQKSFTSTEASLAFAGLFVTGIFVTPVAGAITDRWDTARAAIGATVSSIVGLSLVIVSASSLQFIAGLFAYAVGVTAIWPIMYVYITDQLSPDRIGRDLGALRSIYFALGSLGPAYVGTTAALFGYTAAFASLLGGFVLTIVPLVWLARN